MEEVWRPIKDYSYDVSNLGRVRSYLGVEKTPNYRKVCSSRILHPSFMPYPQVTLCRNKKCTNFLIHQLVLEAFVGPRPSGYHGHHRNGNLKDNRLENLIWISPSDHLALWKFGERHPNAKLKEQDILEIRQLVREGLRQVDVAKMFNISPANVNHIVNRISWTHI